MYNTKYISVIILSIFFVSCRENINHEKLIQIDDLMYHSEKKTLYSGDFYQNNKNGNTIIKGSYDKGTPNRIWNFYNMNGKKIGIVDNEKYDKEFILSSNSYNDFLLGEWINIYEVQDNDTSFLNKENELTVSVYLENKLIIKKKGEVYFGDRHLDLDSLCDWVTYNIEFQNDSIRYYNRTFYNVEFKEWIENLVGRDFEFTCKCEIVDYFTIIENCEIKNGKLKFLSKSIRK